MAPRKPSRAEQKKAVGAFLLVEDDGWETLDRSTIEPWAECPKQAAMLEQKLVTPMAIRDVGAESHEAISQTILEFVDSRGNLTEKDLSNALYGYLQAARPDVQPDVIASLHTGFWRLVRTIWKTDPTSIICFDGGEGDKSGQLAFDIPTLRKTVTSELDLLLATPSKQVVREIDWKTGYKRHTADVVAASFQFQLHALLIFENYPEVEEVETFVWDTRFFTEARPVSFLRKNLDAYRYRVMKAVEMREVHRQNPPGWPSIEKCPTCPAVLLCDVVGQDVKQPLADPVAAVNALVALESRADALKKLLATHVDATGEDIAAGGVAFGRRKPAEKKPAAKLYEIGD